MQKIVSLLLFPLFLFSYDLEVSLPTRPQKTEIYLTTLHVPESAFDWRYFEELRDVLVFDLRYNGLSTVASNREDLDGTFAWPDVRSGFDLAIWGEKNPGDMQYPFSCKTRRAFIPSESEIQISDIHTSSTLHRLE